MKTLSRFALFPACLAFGGLFLAFTVPAAQKKANQYPIIEEAKHKNYKQKLTDKVSFDMVAIPGGTYMMGSPKSEKGRDPDEGPQHPVTVKPFWMGKCEVTWDEFDAWWVKGEKPKRRKEGEKKKSGADALTSPTPPYADETFGHGRYGNPVLCISHHAAMKYCEWLSKKTGKKYRLPTEAEWEWAARAGTTTAYFFGDDPAKLGEYAWYFDNSDDLAQKVGKKKPNPWGLYDIYGNVSEYCIDHYKKDYYSKFPLDKPTLSPVVLPTKSRFSHVARGGSWLDDPDELRSAARQYSVAEWLKRDPQLPQSIWWLTDADFVGFRVVCPVEETKSLEKLKPLVTPDSQNY